MPLQGRKYSSNSYKYGFNGQLKDDEVYGSSNLNSAEFWEYDTRLGRRWETDPIVKPWESPYSCFFDNPIVYSDYYGLTAGDDNKPRPTAKNRSSQTERDVNYYDNAQGKEDSGFDGTNYWKSKVNDKETVVTSTSTNNTGTHTYSFPTPPGDTPGNDATSGEDSKESKAGDPQNDPTPPKTPSDGPPPPKPPKGHDGHDKPPIGPPPAPPTGGPPDAPCSKDLTLGFLWVGKSNKPLEPLKAMAEVIKACFQWDPNCNKTAQVIVRSPLDRASSFKYDSKWGGAPFSIMVDRAKWIQDIMIRTKKIPVNSFLPVKILTDQPGTQSGNVEFK